MAKLVNYFALANHNWHTFSKHSWLFSLLHEIQHILKLFFLFFDGGCSLFISDPINSSKFEFNANIFGIFPLIMNYSSTIELIQENFKKLFYFTDHSEFQIRHRNFLIGNFKSTQGNFLKFYHAFKVCSKPFHIARFMVLNVYCFPKEFICLMSKV